MADAELPVISPWLMKGFRGYVRRYLRKHFHAVRLLRGEGPAAEGGRVPNDAAVLVVLNHASWWDPLSCVRLSEALEGMAGRRHYAPIDAAMLERYGVFKRLGFFGVDGESAGGVRSFLRHSRNILSGPGSAKRALWVTAQGRFADVRERPVALRPGAGHLLSHLEGKVRGASSGRCVVVPMALEYVFWEERTPELLVAIGPVRSVAEGPGEPAAGERLVEAWQSRLSADLEATMDRLAAAAVSRDASRFVALASGRSGVGGVYDAWRRGKASLRGEKFEPGHGGQA